MESWIIAVVAVLVIVAVWYFAIRRPAQKKDTYEGQNYGWRPSDWKFGAADTHPGDCNATKTQTCNLQCQQAPGGMSHSDCMWHCLEGTTS